MHDPRLDAVRTLVNEFKRTRKTRVTSYPESIKARVLSLRDRHSVPKISKAVGVSDVLIYRWQREAAGADNMVDDDPFIELPVEAAVRESKALLQNHAVTVMEIIRGDRSAVLRFECSDEKIGLVLREFLGGASGC